VSAACPACGAAAGAPFYELAGVPSHSCLLLESREQAATYPVGDLELRMCDACGFVFNAAYDASLSRYSPAYEETQGYSARFQDFVDDLARHWVDRYDLTGKRVVEIGCGKGEFLTALVRHGVSEALGLDPGVDPERIPEDLRGRVTVRRGLFPRDLASFDADAVVCRHTLEHIDTVLTFMTDVRTAIGDSDMTVLFELPDALRVFRDGAFWDVYYEHCSYFTAGSLARLFRRVGLEVLDLWRGYDDQYLLIEARADRSATTADPLPLEDDREVLVDAVEGFQRTERALVHRWSAVIENVAVVGDRVAVWGSGSKCVSLMAALGPTATRVGAVIDINPHKWHRYLAGSGHQIVAPKALIDYGPQLVIAMNDIYLNEIRSDLKDLGLDPQLVAL